MGGKRVIIEVLTSAFWHLSFPAFPGAVAGGVASQGVAGVAGVVGKLTRSLDHAVERVLGLTTVRSSCKFDKAD